MHLLNFLIENFVLFFHEKDFFFVVFAEKLGLKAAFHLLMQWFQSSVWKQSDDFFSLEDSTFRWERKHSKHPWIPGCVCQSERFHNMVVPLFSWTPGGIWLCLFCCSPPIDWIVSHLLQVLHQRSSVTTIFFFFCCFFTISPLIDHYFVSLSCWERW